MNISVCVLEIKNKIKNHYARNVYMEYILQTLQWRLIR